MVFSTVTRSFHLLRQHPLLYIPDLVGVLVNYILLYAFARITGATDLISGLSAAEAVPIEILSQFIKENLAQLIVSGAVFFIISFVIGTSVLIYKYSLVRDLLVEKKMSFSKVWKERRGYFWDVVFVRVFTFLITIVALAVALLAGGLLYVVIKPFSETAALYLGVFVGVVLAIALLVLVTLAILFRYPIMFFTKTRSAYRVLAHSYAYLKKHKEYVIVSWLVVLAITIVFGVVSSLLNYLSDLLVAAVTSPIALGVVSVIFVVVTLLVRLTGDLGALIFVSERFKEKMH